MLEISQYIFSSFWIFCGTVILIYVIGESVAMVVVAVSGKEVHYSLINIGDGKPKVQK